MSTTTTPPETTPVVPEPKTRLGKASLASADYADSRLGIYGVARANVRKVFPDHWSFMLGEIALYSFIILLLSGVFLTLFFKPSMVEVVYDGSYTPLQGIMMSEAYASTLEISFDVRGGLLIRQIHHWAALIFVAALFVHMFRIFFTGAFRKPREINWLFGFLLLILAMVNGFTGYSLPDDLLSGTGLRIAEGVILAIPLVGTYILFFLFGGEFPGHDFIPRIFTIHVLLVPAIMVGLLVLHLMLVFYHKHTQWGGPGRTEKNVVGLPLVPVYTAKAGGFFFLVFGVLVVLSGVATINPIWAYGPYAPDQITAGSQPDWYIGFLEGSLRLMPNWEIVAFGHNLTLNVLVPSLVLPGIMFMFIAAYPFIEQWITGDKREHHILDRPRNMPVRTGIGVAWITAYGVLWVAGGNDILADQFDLSINAITWTLRFGFFILPVVAFIVTKRIAMGLQRRDRDKVLHGRETGIIRRSPDGEYSEVHEQLPQAKRWELTQHEQPQPLQLGPAVDERGVARKVSGGQRLRARLSRWYFSEASQVPKVTTEEYRRALEHGHGEGGH
ncbi:cytochrome bc1 complex cytochrome b subunit [Allostreptomyces psammosilenae]|uniref:Cytochrome bc1 complex cytochrome b subunit n=1 Tax=Allostreptomyces psammosilenae TaxID=1892865 RepID=A0A853A2B3_9ACTN|nr:cytochrome bc complex cytochrome b subunit [Allostreptomyces psammosilenae]NYI07024.1 ubiquinol-cytochrome c reductase cytochrome b subunit [Allostreptomyces psammosilenae]